MNLRGVKANTIIIDDVEPTPKRIDTFVLDRKKYMSDDRTLSHCANPIMYSFTELEEMVDWCYTTFGDRGYRPSTMETVWNYQAEPDYVFWFGEEKHLMLFMLRWS